MRAAQYKAIAAVEKYKRREQEAKRSFTWTNTGEAFSGYHAALAALEAAGFSVGTLQRDAPMGLLFGNCCISKWRNLCQEDRDLLDGHLRGDPRHGPMTACIYTNVPHDTVEAFAAMVLKAEHEQGDRDAIAK